MGRLFWKFFLFIWLAQLVGMLGVGAVFWLEHARRSAPGMSGDFLRRDALEPERLIGPPPEWLSPPAAANPKGYFRPERPPPGPGFTIPFLPFVAALLASLACAIGLAWYVAKPIRQLRGAFDAAAEGDLNVRVGGKMGGRRDELADLGRNFDRMTERLEALVNGQRNLLHDVSHEMRSPLARLQAAIGLARQQPARTENSLERIERESERMNRLVGELLTLSRLDSGVHGPREPIDMEDLLNNIVEDARFEGAARGVSVDFVVGELPEINADAELLFRAIENIVRNALRHSPDGEAIRIEAGMLGEVFRLAVIDRGSGVSAENLASIFQPFFRGGEQPSGDGYGLGLAIAKRVVASLGGRIKAENGREGGLVVEIILGSERFTKRYI